VNAMLVAVMLNALFWSQVPPALDPAPVIQEPAPLPGLPLTPTSELQKPAPSAPQDNAKPRALSPVSLGSEVRPGTVTPPTGADGDKPPAFKLIDIPKVPESVPGKPLPETKADLLPPGTVATACLVLERSGPAEVKAGQAFTYDIVVHNAGRVTASQARLEEELPAGTKFVGSQPAPITQGERLTWNLENIAPGSEQRIKVEVETSQAGEWKSHATLTVTVASALQTRILSAPVPLLAMSGPGSLPVGHPAAFTIRVSNTTGAPLTDVVLRVQMAPGLQHVQGQAIEGPLGDLAPGQSREVTLDTFTTQAGRLSVEAVLLSNNKGMANAQASVTVTEQQVLALRLIDAPSPSQTADQEIKLEVANRSAVELRDVVVTEMLPNGCQFLSADAGGTFDSATRTVRWLVPALLPGQSRQLAFRAILRGAGPMVNRVTARSRAGGPEAQLHSILRMSAP
jgi:uncharacterized repeat protein (TIGR01451 family)